MSVFLGLNILLSKRKRVMTEAFVLTPDRAECLGRELVDLVRDTPNLISVKVASDNDTIYLIPLCKPVEITLG